jgi:hypothetical protein
MAEVHRETGAAEKGSKKLQTHPGFLGGKLKTTLQPLSMMAMVTDWQF